MMEDQLVILVMHAEQALYTGLTLYAIGWMLIGVLIGLMRYKR